MAAPEHTTADRPWFALYEIQRRSTRNRSAYDCIGWIDSMRGDALTDPRLRSPRAESARRDGVYPGTIRELRRKYQLDWAGWDR